MSRFGRTEGSDLPPTLCTDVINCIPKRKNALFYSSSSRVFPCPETSSTNNNRTQPMRNAYHPELSLPSNILLFKATPPNFLLLSIKFLSFYLWTCLWFDLACVSQISTPLLFSSKPILLVKELVVLFLRLTHITK